MTLSPPATAHGRPRGRRAGAAPSNAGRGPDAPRPPAAGGAGAGRMAPFAAHGR